MMNCRFLYLLTALLLLGVDLQAQYRVDGTGMQFGSMLGRTNLPDNQFNFYGRAFIRQDFNFAFQGEASIGFGFINGVQYKTRLIPVEYRVHYKPYKGRKVWAFEAINFEPFLFTGLGGLFYAPVSVRANDDPMTIEAGPSIPGSSYWDYNRGITGFIPLGAGVEFGLERGNQFVVTAGYNQSLSNSITGFESGFANGYWGVTAGFKLSRPKKARPPVQARTYRPNLHVNAPVEARKPKSLSIEYTDIDLITKIDLRHILFHTLSAELISDYQPGLQKIQQILKRDESIHLKIHGHTDNRGLDMMNLSLSEERAWAAALHLIRNGISPDRLEIFGHGSYHPAADNETENGRALNRRIEIEAHREEPSRPANPELNTGRLLSAEPGSVLMRNKDKWFDWATNDLVNNSMNEVLKVVGTLQQNPDWGILIACNADPRKSPVLGEFLSLARAERIRRELIEHGVPLENIHTARMDEVPDEYSHLIPQSGDQATVIIRTK